MKPIKDLQTHSMIYGFVMTLDVICENGLAELGGKHIVTRQGVG